MSIHVTLSILKLLKKKKLINHPINISTLKNIHCYKIYRINSPFYSPITTSIYYIYPKECTLSKNLQYGVN